MAMEFGGHWRKAIAAGARGILRRAFLPRNGSQAPVPARILVSDIRVLLLLRPLLCGPADRDDGPRRATPTQAQARRICRAAPGAGWIVVGLRNVGLSQAIWHRLRGDD